MLPGWVVSCPSLSFIWDINLPFHSLWTSQTSSQPLALAQTNPVRLDFISDWKLLFKCQFDLYLASNLFLEQSCPIFVVCLFSSCILDTPYYQLWICIWTDFLEPSLHLHFSSLPYIKKTEKEYSFSVHVLGFAFTYTANERLPTLEGRHGTLTMNKN